MAGDTGNIAVPQKLVRISKVVGENEDGLTLFVPKDEQGVFHLTEGDKFLTMMFIHSDEDGYAPWLPWEGDDA